MKIRLQDGFLYVSACLTYRGQDVTLDNVLLDTACAGTIFSSEKLATIGLQFDAGDAVRSIRGVAGSEFVFTKRVDRLALDNLRADGFDIEVGSMDYGLDVDGILGLDFLTRVGATINLARLEIYPARQ